ncbi:acyl carrier protein [Streptomyces sp. yr375]|uniref:phosphopantetheine-binding protein n=1 Tax=Streptomyces sp. yr375 TaxID=1761906 RepID=UPI0008CB78C2|nr:phosphopantetheine-binding protein [Streptomyces sp. yr375]SEP69606.1 acyl carrier protein [Streptomyces sp. yr375]
MSATYDQIVGILVEELGQSREELRPESTFKDLELDSLSLLELGVILQERTGVTLEGVDAGCTLAETAAALDRVLAPTPVESAR